MSTAWIRASLALWRRRERARKQLHAKAQQELNLARAGRASESIIRRLTERRDLRSRQLREARQNVERREQQLADRQGPRIITARHLGLRFQDVFGPKGTVVRGAGHYTAGPRASDAAELAAEARKDHAFHQGNGWGGASYEAMVADDGTLALLNPAHRKSAAVAMNNTGMWNLVHPGTTGDRMTPAAAATLRWYLANAHTRRIPKEHRSPVDLRTISWRGHREYPQNSTACPGVMLNDYREMVW
jgi:hypothetical protein